MGLFLRFGNHFTRKGHLYELLPADRGALALAGHIPARAGRNPRLYVRHRRPKAVFGQRKGQYHYQNRRLRRRTCRRNSHFCMILFPDSPVLTVNRI